MSADWDVFGVYCDGRDADTPHSHEPIAMYRRLPGESGGRIWAPLYTSNDRDHSLDGARVWLRNNVFQTEMFAPIGDAEPSDNFKCALCGRNLRLGGGYEVELVLDFLHQEQRPRITLKEWERARGGRSRRVRPPPDTPKP